MKREPYIITQNLSVQEIVELLKRAYEEGYADGTSELVSITTPITTPGITWNPTPVVGTPNDQWWKSPNIYCSNEETHISSGKTENSSLSGVKPLSSKL